MKFDITDRLMANEAPVLVIGDVEIKVNASAKDVLKVMNLFKDGFELEAIEKAQEILFTPEDVQKLVEYPTFIWKEIVSYAAQVAISGELEPETTEDPKPTPVMI